jgi:hypothetical protein
MRDAAQNSQNEWARNGTIPRAPIPRSLHAAVHSRSNKGVESEKKKAGVRSREQRESLELGQKVRIVGRRLANTRSQESVQKLAKAALGPIWLAVSLSHAGSRRYRKR